MVGISATNPYVYIAIANKVLPFYMQFQYF